MNSTIVIEWDVERDVWFTYAYIVGIHDDPSGNQPLEGATEVHPTLEAATERAKAWHRVEHIVRSSGGLAPPDSGEVVITLDKDGYAVHTFDGVKHTSSWDHAAYMARLETVARVLNITKEEDNGV